MERKVNGKTIPCEPEEENEMRKGRKKDVLYLILGL